MWRVYFDWLTFGWVMALRLFFSYPRKVHQSQILSGLLLGNFWCDFIQTLQKWLVPSQVVHIISIFQFNDFCQSYWPLMIFISTTPPRVLMQLSSAVVHNINILHFTDFVSRYENIFINFFSRYRQIFYQVCLVIFLFSDSKQHCYWASVHVFWF